MCTHFTIKTFLINIFSGFDGAFNKRHTRVENGTKLVIAVNSNYNDGHIAELPFSILLYIGDF